MNNKPYLHIWHGLAIDTDQAIELIPARTRYESYEEIDEAREYFAGIYFQSDYGEEVYLTWDDVDSHIANTEAANAA